MNNTETMVRLIMGSINDREKADKLEEVWKKINLPYKKSVASCHKHGGGDFTGFIKKINEKIIVFLGGMELAAPGLVEVVLKKADAWDKIVFAVPLDKAARSAVENLPKGTSIITGGLNEISLSHSLVNSALAVARLAYIWSYDEALLANLKKWYREQLEENPLIEDLNS